MNILISTLAQGLIFAILAFGIYITFRILNFADMTAEGSLTLGGSVCAILMTNMNLDPLFATIIAGFIGSLAGLITGFLNTKLKIQDILSGILTMIALYSINLRIMGKANVSLLGKNTIFRFLNSANNSQTSVFLVSLTICLVFLIILSLFFKTRLGLAIRATGDNEQMAKVVGINTDLNKILALMISNFLCAISGALIVQNQGFADINMGTGMLVIALASIVIGEAIIKNFNFLARLISCIIGSICYRFVIFFVLNLGMSPSDLKLLTAAIVSILLAFPNVKKLLKNFIRRS